MRRFTSLLLCSSLSVSGAACAAGPLDFYFGAGVGQSVLKQDYYQVDSHATGWKLVAGWRPLSLLGAEIDYADLGDKSVNYPTSHVSTKAHATSVFGVGYLPLPEPWLAIYGKLGATRVEANTHFTYTGGCPVGGCSVPDVTTDSSSTKFAWGAGAELKLGLPGVRFEYERLNGPQGEDALLSLAVTLNF